MKNIFIKLITLIPYFKFKKSCKNIEQSFILNWEETKDILLKGNFWKTKGLTQDLELENFDITKYSDYEDAIHSSIQNMKSELNNEDILFIAKTSGFTGVSKKFLITKSFKKQFQCASPPFVHHIASTFPNFASEPILYLASAGEDEKEGYISHYNYMSMSKFFKKNYVLPEFVLSSQEKYILYAPIYSILSDLSAIIAITPTSILNFWKKILEILPNFEKIAAQLNIYIPQDRVTFLKNILNSKPFETITAKDLWPTLTVCITWKTSICKLALPTLKNMLGNNVHIHDAIYSATEGWFNVPLDIHNNGGVYQPEGVILEFIPVDQEVSKKHILKPWMLKKDQKYRVLITNKMGLIRYQIFDIIQCNGFWNNSPIIEFVEKESGSISLGIVRINDEQFIKALSPLEEHAVKSFFSTDKNGSGLYLCLDAQHFMNFSDDNLINLRNSVEKILFELIEDYARDVTKSTMPRLKLVFIEPIVIQIDGNQSKAKLYYPYERIENHIEKTLEF